MAARIGFSARLRKTTARLTVVLLLLGAAQLAGATASLAAVTDPFTRVFSVNTNGDIQIRGNTLMTCSTTTHPNSSCCASRCRTPTSTP